MLRRIINSYITEEEKAEYEALIKKTPQEMDKRCILGLHEEAMPHLMPGEDWEIGSGSVVDQDAFVDRLHWVPGSAGETG